MVFNLEIEENFLIVDIFWLILKVNFKNKWLYFSVLNNSLIKKKDVINLVVFDEKNWLR